VKQIKIRDKEYNCSNKVYYHIQGLESENRVISMELIGHENNELQQQKEIERLNNALNKAIEYIEYYFAKGRTKNHKQFDLSLYEILTGKNLFNLTMKEIEQFFKGVDKE